MSVHHYIDLRSCFTDHRAFTPESADDNRRYSFNCYWFIITMLLNGRYCSDENCSSKESKNPIPLVEIFFQNQKGSRLNKVVINRLYKSAVKDSRRFCIITLVILESVRI